jgi:hypothetical protein
MVSTTAFCALMREFCAGAAPLDRSAHGQPQARHATNVNPYTRSYRLAKYRTGNAASCSKLENRTRARMDRPYSNPMVALPRNQATPKAVSKTPNAVLRFCGGTIPANTALRDEAPQNHARQGHGGVRREKPGVLEKAGRENASRKAGRPTLSNNQPRTREASAPTTIATERVDAIVEMNNPGLRARINYSCDREDDETESRRDQESGLRPDRVVKDLHVRILAPVIRETILHTRDRGT